VHGAGEILDVLPLPDVAFAIVALVAFVAFVILPCADTGTAKLATTPTASTATAIAATTLIVFAFIKTLREYILYKYYYV
jgi:exosortase/archaeosortase